MLIPVGIDLGTTFSVIACYRNDRVEIISDGYGQRVIPSVVYYEPGTGKVFVGREAYENSTRCPLNLIKGITNTFFLLLTIVYKKYYAQYCSARGRKSLFFILDRKFRFRL